LAFRFDLFFYFSLSCSLARSLARSLALSLPLSLSLSCSLVRILLPLARAWRFALFVLWLFSVFFNNAFSLEDFPEDSTKDNRNDVFSLSHLAVLSFFPPSLRFLSVSLSLSFEAVACALSFALFLVNGKGLVCLFS
jgi:hypothetical protein